MKKLPECDFDFLVRQTRLILSSYRYWLGKSLWLEDKPDEVLVKEVFFAPFVLASSDTQEDPVLNYGNQMALDLWEMDWAAFTLTRGRNTAEPVERREREQFLERVKKQGYVDDYRGIRISSKGRRFEIRQATVWNLRDEAGQYTGQAATFKTWKELL